MNYESNAKPIPDGIILDLSSIKHAHCLIYLSNIYLGQVQIIIFGATLV